LAALENRKLWLVGIGGVGMSGLALVAKARGAEVAGSDRAMSATTERLMASGIAVTIGHAAENVPEGFEIVASSAIASDNPELAGRLVMHRATLLAQLIEESPSIVVAGAHGKTTTASMIAFCLDRLGDDPTFMIGGGVPQLGTNARAGRGWTVAEGDESDGSLLALSPTIAVITNIDHDHHTTFASRSEVSALFDTWLSDGASGAKIVRGDDVDAGKVVDLSVPGDHNRVNAACAIAALVHAGFERSAIEQVLPDFTGVSRRLEAHGEVDGVLLYDDYAHHPTEVTATLRAARSLTAAGRVIAVFQPHLFSRTEHLAREFGAALALADAVCVVGIYAAREQPRPGVSAKLVVDAISDQRQGIRVGFAPRLADAAPIVSSWLRPGDVLLTLGAGDVNTLIPLVARELA
jgi:UDP-N-acetylmuramate--alanine ligase